MSKIPLTDLRITFPIGEPYVKPKPQKPKRKDFESNPEAISLAVVLLILLSIFILITSILGVSGIPVAIFVVLGFIGKLKI